MSQSRGVRIGVDVGGTKIEAVVLGESGDVLAKKRAPTPQGEYAATLETIHDLIGAVETDAGVSVGKIGFGTPGSLSPATGLIRNANSTCLNDHALDVDLARVLARPVRVVNDADCFALAEAKIGAAAGARTVFGVITGTGVGGGVVVNGALVDGANRISGEWGHNRMPYDPSDDGADVPCYCGRRGCIEALCSGPGMQADHTRMTGETLIAQEICAKADAGDSAARETLSRHVRRVARGLSLVTNILDPDVIVLGGGLSNMKHLYAELPAAMEPHVFSDTFLTKIVPNKLGDSAGVFGAAWLWSVEEVSA